MEQILAFMQEEFRGMDRIYFHYFELAFWTGMRTSELLAPPAMEPIVSDQAPGRFWRKVLRKLGIRYRTA